MKLFDTKHKQKSAVITSGVLILLLFLMYGFGMKYQDPPIEYGVAINFGDSNVGSGDPVENVKATEPVQEEVQEEQEEVEEEQVEETPQEVVEEEVITNDSVEDVPVVEKTEEKPQEKVEEVKEEVKPKEQPKPKPSKAATEALNSLLNGSSSDGKPQGEGDDARPGVKGDKNGDPKSNKYYGSTAGGSGGNYNLAGRKALSKPIEKPDCQEEGTVVVSIEVNQSGNVIKAQPGARGTTNTAPCLFDAAKKAALRTKWNADGDAPVKQIGTIIYKFSLSK